MTEQLDRFRDWRFGLFVHFGLYALPARHEWVKNRERLTDADYQKYFDHFDPDLYDPATWARPAREAGMKYVVLTTKHHEGFCLWDSRGDRLQGDEDAVRQGPDRRLRRGFRAEGLKVGFYHSLIDWHHPDFPVDGGASAARRRGRSRRERRPRHRQVRRLPARAGARAADRVRPDRRICGSTSPTRTGPRTRRWTRQGPGRLAVRGAGRDGPRTAARASWSTTGSDLPRPTSSRRSSTSRPAR